MNARCLRMKAPRRTFSAAYTRRLRSGWPSDAKLWNSTWARLTEKDWASMALLHPLPIVHDHLRLAARRVLDHQVGWFAHCDSSGARRWSHCLPGSARDFGTFRHRDFRLRTRGGNLSIGNQDHRIWDRLRVEASLQ